MFYTSLSDAERDKLKTERQWLRKGFVPLCPDAGTVMYSNHFCNGQYRYLTAEEVRPATDAELAPYRNAPPITLSNTKNYHFARIISAMIGAPIRPITVYQTVGPQPTVTAE